jgi:branched-chain amino acid transport system permease protein
MLTLAHAAFWGIGAYASAIITTRLGMPVIVGLSGALIISFAAGSLLALAAARTKGDLFIIATFAFQLIVNNIQMGWKSVTGGSSGISGVLPLFVPYGGCSSTWLYAITFGLLMICCVTISYLIANSPFGRLLKGIREDELLMASLGRRFSLQRAKVCSISAGIAGLAGGFYVHYIGYIDPTSFTIWDSIFLLTIVLLGGSDSIAGAILGATVLVFLPEITRSLGIPGVFGAHLRQMIFGLALILLSLYRPQGLLGGFRYQGGDE